MTRRRQRTSQVEVETVVEIEEVEEAQEEVEEEVGEEDGFEKRKRGRKAASSELIVNERWMINSDANQWKVNQRTGATTWAPKVYLNSLSSCLKWLVEHEIRVSEYSSLRELADNIDNIKAEIGQFIKDQGLDPIW